MTVTWTDSAFFPTWHSLPENDLPEMTTGVFTIRGELFRLKGKNVREQRTSVVRTRTLRHVARGDWVILDIGERLVSG